MTTVNLFELLGGDDAEDPSQLVAASLKVEKTKKAPAGAQPPAAQQAKTGAKMPTKPLPPAQAVKESKNDTGRGGRGGRGYGSGRGRGGGFNRDSGNNENTYGSNNGISGGYRPSEDSEGKTFERRGGYGAPRSGGGGFRGGRRGGFSNTEGGEGDRPRRTYERHSGTGRGNEFKREGSGRGNWGTATDEIAPETDETVNEVEKNVVVEKQLGEEDVADIKEAPVNEAEEKEPEEKEMTLEEYEKVLEEKRKALLALKTEERKVNVDKDFESMQQLSNKKTGDEIFIKLGSEKDKRKEATEKEERAKKSLSINEFLKPAEGERYYGDRERGRGRGRGGAGGRGQRGGFSHGGGNDARSAGPAPSIQDPALFPSLGGK